MTNVTSDVKAAIRAKHQPPDWLVAFEVQVVGRGTRLQFADAVAIDLRQSAGHAVHGFEVKVSRADWLREVADPGKAKAARSHCDHWWIVAGADDIVKADELPPGVGLLVADPAGLRLVVPAGIGDAWRQGFHRAFLAAVLRRSDPMEPRAYWEGQVRQAERKGYAKGRSEAVRVAGRRERASPAEPGVDPATGQFCP